MSATSRDSNDRFPRDGVTVSTDTYQWRATGRWMVREVHVTKPGVAGNYGADLIDRWKGRAFQQSPDSTISVVGFEDEQVNWEANSSLLGERCGPVRCMREVWGADSGTNVTKTETFYRDAVASRYRVRVHPIPPDGLYTNWDYNRGAMVPTAAEKAAGVQGGRYFTALRPNGVPVDGVNDDVGQIDRLSPDPLTGMCATLDGPQPAENYGGVCPLFFDAADPTFNLPLAFDNWEQVSGKGDLGSLVYVFELKGATSFTNPLVVPYYRDDACLDDGTGDDPVRRPYPGETSTDSRVKAGYAAAAGTAYENLRCSQKQGAYAAHGVHYFFTHDSDNAFVMGKPLTEADAQWWQIMVPTAQPENRGAEHANVIRVPVQAVVTPRMPSTPDTSAQRSGGVAGFVDGLTAVLSSPAAILGYVLDGTLQLASQALTAFAQITQSDSPAEVVAVSGSSLANLTLGTTTDARVLAGVGVVDMTPDVGYGAGQYSDTTDIFDGISGGDIDPYLTHKKQKTSYGVQSRLTARAIVVEGTNGKRIALLKIRQLPGAGQPDAPRWRRSSSENGSSIGYDADPAPRHPRPQHDLFLDAGWRCGRSRTFTTRASSRTRRASWPQAILDAEGSLRPARMGATTVRHKIFKGNVVRPHHRRRRHARRLPARVRRPRPGGDALRRHQRARRPAAARGLGQLGRAPGRPRRLRPAQRGFPRSAGALRRARPRRAAGVQPGRRRQRREIRQRPAAPARRRHGLRSGRARPRGGCARRAGRAARLEPQRLRADRAQRALSSPTPSSRAGTSSAASWPWMRDGGIPPNNYVPQYKCR